MSLQIVLKEEVPRNAVFVTGFQGIGITGYIAIRHIVSTLNAKPLGFILLSKMPPFVWMEENRLATPIQLFKYENHVFMLVEFMPSPPELYKFINKVCEWVASKFSEALLIGGLDLRVKKEGETERAKFAATSQAIAKVLDKGYKVLDRGLYITGPLALMLMKFEQLNFPAIAILAYANASRPDPMAAAVAIEYFSKMYGIEVKTEQLIKDAQRIEAEIEENLKKKQERIKSEASTLYI
ncbi:MAG: proteasome assembly chaperone family protein [Candidatus Nezhaarchaeales archaeon]